MRYLSLGEVGGTQKPWFLSKFKWEKNRGRCMGGEGEMEEL
jgi:hypothetical protein